MFKNLLFYSTLASAYGVAFGQTILGPTSTITVSNARVSPDGHERSAVVANGVHPGPLISASKTDNFAINVVNNLDDPRMLRSTSMHWHGLFQKGTNWADGADGVNQCPISPEHSFQYKFSPAGHAGTFWYHSHFGTQYCDGLRGPMVVYDPQDPYLNDYDVDDENTIITLVDWFHAPAPRLSGALNHDATLINGVGRTPGGQAIALSQVNVLRGSRYRFRLISLACDANFMFSIDGHRLTVIEADGQLTDPYEVDRIQIFAGQRYSFILTANIAKGAEGGNFRIRAGPNIGVPGLSGVNTFTNGVNSAVLRYNDADPLPANGEPTSTANPNPEDLNESLLHAHAGSSPAAPGTPTPGGADVVHRFVFGFTGGRFTVNGVSYTSPDVPTLLQIMSGTRNPADLLPAGSVIPLGRNQVVELVIPNTNNLAGSPHPFHLHGHAFSVVRSAGSSTYNFANPVRRDVVNMGGAGSEVTIRFTTDNPGPWFFHCHIEPHLETGLAIVFAEDVEGMGSSEQLNASVPDEWKQLCPIFEALTPEQTFVDTVAPFNRRAEPTSAKFRF